MSKDECVGTCRQMEEIRRLQFSQRDISECRAIDYNDDNRFLVGHAEYRHVA
ncbi:MAG: hypothetical protein HF981_05485 [Desulfobacteraceae bacterium]|nr:hypothetical protein [Desulfobacteraceae bacterium]MBC2749820.1 hypothetical protein [Desulfobacteraceae bacterium]